MKKYTFLFLIALCGTIMSCVAGNVAVSNSASTSVVPLVSDDDGLCSAVEALRAAVTAEQIEAAATTLEAVRQQDADNWLAHYHTAYAYGRIAHSCANLKEVDGWVEKADAAIKASANCANADASEIFVMESYLNYARIRVNPMIRGYKLSKTAMGQLGSALEVNGDNPRAYLLITQHLLNVPAMLGGDPDKACKYNDAAQKTYNSEAADKNRDTLSPSWGRPDSDEIASSFCGDAETTKRD